MTRTRRRFSVFSLYFGYCGMLLAWGTGAGVRPPLLIGFGLFALEGLWSVLRARRALIQETIGMLDERQRTVRDRAYYSAYRILGVVAAAGVGYSALAQLNRIPSPDLSSLQIMLLAGGVVLLVVTLPSAIMAWTEPDPPEDSGAYNMVNRSSFNPSPK